MLFASLKKLSTSLSLIAVVGVSASAVSIYNAQQQPSTVQNKQSYIVSANDFTELKATLASHHIIPSHQLGIINSVAVDLTGEQLANLKRAITVKVTPNYKVSLSGTGYGWGKRKWQPKSDVVDYIGATEAHASRNFGDGVTIGFLDTGLEQLSGLSNDLYGYDKFWGTYDAVNNSISNYGGEESGHGTHVASIAVNSDYDVYGKIYGVAPNASLVGIKAFDGEGKASYADVIRGIDWAIQVKDQINLRVLNMSFSGPVRSYYWDDPLNKAVMKAWQAGIVVVASAGNTGPNPMSIGVPGNVPYIITVGAMTDSYTKSYFEDDKLATFSSAGPTVESFIKPEIVAPGGHISGLMAYDSQIVTEHPEFHDGGRYFEMSGTSQAAAVVSGAVALLLHDDPSLSPDDVKCRLIENAQLATNDLGELAYSVFQQGAGVINVKNTLASTSLGCANTNMDIAKDIADSEHYYGPANVDEKGNFFVEGAGSRYQWNVSEELDSDGGLIWNNNLSADGGLIWNNSLGTDGGLIWNNSVGVDGGLIWNNSVNVNGGLIWNNSINVSGGLIWNNSVDVDGGLIWNNSVDFTNAEPIAVNSWVDQQ